MRHVLPHKEKIHALAFSPGEEALFEWDGIDVFPFEDGLILSHRDRFDFHRWARQALGPLGAVLGWSGWLRGRVAAEASRTLERFRATHPA